jgi:hypothetical protein
MTKINHIKINWTKYFKIKIKGNETKKLPQILSSQDFKLHGRSQECNNSISLGIPVLTKKGQGILLNKIHIQLFQKFCGLRFIKSPKKHAIGLYVAQIQFNSIQIITAYVLLAHSINILPFISVSKAVYFHNVFQESNVYISSFPHVNYMPHSQKISLFNFAESTRWKLYTTRFLFFMIFFIQFQELLWKNYAVMHW